MYTCEGSTSRGPKGMSALLELELQIAELPVCVNMDAGIRALVLCKSSAHS